VPAREAADYLLSLAARVDGRPGRDAIGPAMLADSATVTPQLLAIARDQSRARETRSTAINWLNRASDERGGVSPSQLAKALGDIARDENDNQQVRQNALRVLSRQENGEGVPALIDISRSTPDVWLGKQALSTLAQSGDPRARGYLRTAVQRDDLNDDMRVAAIRGIGRDYATSQDADFLRSLYTKLPSEKTKEAVLSSLGEMGGTANAKWLMSIAGNVDESIRLRRRAVQLSDRAGTTVADLAQLYDRVDDPQMKDALISTLAQNGTKSATDKLLAIAKNDTNYSLRRRAVSALGRSEDPRVKDALKEIVEK
jgi:HEAT repeat protein